MAEFEEIVLVAVGYFQPVSRVELLDISGREVKRQLVPMVDLHNRNRIFGIGQRSYGLLVFPAVPKVRWMVHEPVDLV